MSFSRHKRHWLQGIVAFSLLFLPACTMSSNGTKNVITVGSTHIDLNEAKRDFRAILSGLPKSVTNREAIKKELLEQLIDRYLILEYGKEHHICVSERDLALAMKKIRMDFTDEGFREALLRDYIDLDQWKEQLRKRLLEKKIIAKVTEQLPPPGHTAVLRYYETHADSFRTGRQVKFRQIVTNEPGKARELLKRIQQGEDFARVAMEGSIAPEAKNGGMVGWVAEGELEKTMDKALFSLKPGEISPIIHSPYGYHLFQVLRTRPAGIRPLPQVIGEIENRISRERRRIFITKWLKAMRKNVKVEVNPKFFQMLEQ